MTAFEQNRESNATSDPPVVAAFDFDGTLSVRDCLVPFLLQMTGRARLVARVVRQPAALFGAAVHLDRDRFKAVVVRAAYAGRDVGSVERIGASYAATIEASLLRADVTRRLVWHQNQGHRVVIVSASLGAYLHPLGKRLGVDGVLCSEVLVGNDLRYTGVLIDGNCRGREKQRRLHRWLRAHGLEAAEIWAYGDSRGDRELLQAADHPVNVKDRSITEAPEPAA